MKNRILVFLALSALLMMVGCSSGGGGTSGGGEGTLSLSLTDAPADRYRAVYVTIKEVQVHLSGNENSPNNWKSIEQFDGPKTVNLLELVNGVREELGLVSLPAGHYTQMRLIVEREPDNSINLLSQAHPFANYVIEQGEPANIHELKVPSGYQTGVKIVRGFDISADETTELMLDFDAGRSVVQAGASGKWLLKPTIRVVNVDEYAIVNGTIVDSDAESTLIPGAMVSLQVYDPDAFDPKDEVKVVAATITDENGGYQLFVEPDDYNLVVYAAGKKVGFREIGVEEGPWLIEDMALETVGEGKVSGKVTIVGAEPEEQYATLSFRQDMGQSNSPNLIEIQSVNILNGYEYEISLPINGYYTIVGSSFGYESETYPIHNTTDVFEQDVNFGES